MTRGLSTSGLLLLVLALLALSGFVTGNLDRWIDYLFNPTRPSASSAGATAAAAKASSADQAVGTATPAMSSIGATTQRVTT